MRGLRLLVVALVGVMAVSGADDSASAMEAKLAELLAEQRAILDASLRQLRQEYDSRLAVAEETAAAAVKRCAHA